MIIFLFNNYSIYGFDGVLEAPVNRRTVGRIFSIATPPVNSLLF